MTRILHKNRFGNLLHAPLGEWFGELLENSLPAQPAWHAPASIWEAEDGYHVELDLPGVRQDDLELTFENGGLQISAERRAPEGDRTNWHDERGHGKITRLVSLPETIAAGAIDARLIDGVLHVLVPKKPEAQPKRIEIKGE